MYDWQSAEKDVKSMAMSVLAFGYECGLQI